MINRGKEAEARSDDRAVEAFMKQRYPAEMTSVEISETMGLPPGRVWGALNRLSGDSIMVRRDGNRWIARSGERKA